jgi:nucleoside-diphosphate kinase
MNTHRTLLILKPDGYKRNLLIPILRDLEHCVRVARVETRYLTKGDVRFLYGRYAGKSFYLPLQLFMISGASMIMELVGNHAVSRVRKIVGEGGYPYPKNTIRGNYATATRRNVVHCSDCTESAVNELYHFFPEELE